ncbi:MAG: PA2779 family protein [Gammaproteobacteria bacterium]|nr:PA2779 family protein [Gammaproteobacteria bacterium]NVK87579.1 PA2779 family protein [Gammaproteobacteria bacterium]
MKSFVISTLSALYLILSINVAHADVVSSDSVMQQQQVQYTKEQILAFIDTKEVQNKLEQLGVPKEQAIARVQHMTEQELIAFHTQLESMPAGEGVVGAIVTVLVVIALLDVLGVTDVYPFIRPI